MRANSVGVGSINKVYQLPCACGNAIPLARFKLGYQQCLLCGEKTAKKLGFLFKEHKNEQKY